jgi:hypothetical protein
MKRIAIGIVMLAASFTGLAQDGPVDRTYGCLERMVRDPRLAIIADKVALVHGPGLKAAPALERSVNTEERAAVALWLDLRERCFFAGGHYRFTALTPHEHIAMQGAFEFQQRLLANLAQGGVTYSQFNRRRLELAEGLYWGI